MVLTGRSGDEVANPVNLLFCVARYRSFSRARNRPGRAQKRHAGGNARGSSQTASPKRCLKGFKTEWINPYYAIGFSRLLSSNRFLAMYAGKIIVAYGTPKPLFAPPTVKHGRSMSPDADAQRLGGRQTRHAPATRTPVGAPAPSAFAVTRIERFSGLTVKAVGDKLRRSAEKPPAPPIEKRRRGDALRRLLRQTGRAPSTARARQARDRRKKEASPFPATTSRDSARSASRPASRGLFASARERYPQHLLRVRRRAQRLLKTPPRCSKRGRKY
jgi:hypothetical protein